MRNGLVLMALLLLLTACGSRNAPNDQIGESPRYIEESDYSGDEQAIVRLINQRIKYSFEQNETEYMKLFHEFSPISGLQKYRLHTVKLLEDIHIQEQNYSHVAVVRTEDAFLTGESFNNQYVFIKWKKPGADWKIADID